uniref:Uncharacterized protein n=1 Tax=Anguilla anguilla TaxID=7936 RepID=A0A0E9PGF1_ANGAN
MKFLRYYDAPHHMLKTSSATSTSQTAYVHHVAWESFPDLPQDHNMLIEFVEEFC